jgi:hypothetical protein
MAAAMVGVRFVERRQTQRLRCEECDWLTVVRLLPGREAQVVDLSPTGALIETPVRLLPGSGVSLLLGATDWRQLIEALIVRCAVFALIPENGVRYRAGLLFRGEVVFPSCRSGYLFPIPAQLASEGPGTSYPTSQELPCGSDETELNRPVRPWHVT